MKREDTRKAYYWYSEKASDIARQLAFAGIAVIWVFKVDGSDGPAIANEFVWPGVLVLITLTLDLLQYAWGAAAWGVFNRKQEMKKVPEAEEFEAPRQINWPTLVLFWGKLAMVAAAYVFLIIRVGRRVVGG